MTETGGCGPKDSLKQTVIISRYIHYTINLVEVCTPPVFSS